MKLPVTFSSHPPLIEETIPTLQTSWSDHVDGELAVDVWGDLEAFYVRAAIAGVSPQDLEITLESDLLTIRGARPEDPSVPDELILVRECHFGNFSRTIILPEETNPDSVSANLKNGVLLITIPKIKGGTIHVPLTYNES